MIVNERCNHCNEITLGRSSKADDFSVLIDLIGMERSVRWRILNL